MNRPTPSDAQDEHEIRGWIAEAGDCRVERPPSTSNRCARLLLERASSAPGTGGDPPDDLEGAPLGIGLIRLFALAGLAAAALFAAVYLWTPSANAWARVAQALHDQKPDPFVEAGADGLDEESWISPRFQILARKHRRGAELQDAEFEDIDMGFKEEYIAESNTIYRDQTAKTARGRRRRRAQELEVYGQLLNPESVKTSPIPGSEIVSEGRREVLENGKTWNVYDLTLRSSPADSSPDLKMIGPGPPENRIAPNVGHRGQRRDDPADIRLPRVRPGRPPGARRPRDGQTRESPPRRFPTCLELLLTGLKVGRNRFDDYCGYVWNESGWSRSPARLAQGPKWRVERDFPDRRPGTAIPGHDRVPTRSTWPG